MSRLIKNRAREVMERNWIIIQTGEGKMPVLVAQNHPKGMFLTRMRFCPLSSGNESFFCVFLFFFWRKTTARVRKMFVLCESRLVFIYDEGGMENVVN